MKNKTQDLIDHLFMQLERLGNEDQTPQEVELECKRGIAMVAVADQILRREALQVQVAKIVSDHGNIDPRPYLPQHGNTAAPPLR